MVETMLPTRSRTQRAARPGARLVAAAAAGLHGHPGVNASQFDGIRAGLAHLWAAIAALARDLSTPMLSLVIAHVVAFCTRHVWGVIIVALILAAASAAYTVRHTRSRHQRTQTRPEGNGCDSPDCR